MLWGSTVKAETSVAGAAICRRGRQVVPPALPLAPSRTLAPRAGKAGMSQPPHSKGLAEEMSLDYPPSPPLPALRLPCRRGSSAAAAAVDTELTQVRLESTAPVLALRL